MDQVLLLTVNSKLELYGITADKWAAVQPNIYMGLLASYLKSEDVPVEMIDGGLSIPDLCDYIDKYQFKMVGVVCSGANPASSTMSMVGAIKFFKEYNKKKRDTITTFICGGHPTVEPVQTLKDTGVDYVIRGEGYKTIASLFWGRHINYKSDGIAYRRMVSGDYHVGAIPELIDVNKLPMIDWHIQKPQHYRAHNWHSFDNINARTPYGTLWTSFGCPYNCSFCCINNIFGRRSYRLRDMQSVLAEIDVLVTKYGVRNIKILDELFVIKHKRMDEFIEGLEKRGYDLNMWAYARIDTVDASLLKRLSKVGMRWIVYGMETVSQNILDSAHKQCDANTYEDVIQMTRDAGMYICADFIVGLWEDNFDTMQESYDFAVRHNFEWLNMYPAFAYPGTELYEDYIKRGRIKRTNNWEAYSLYGYNCDPLPTKYLKASEVLKWRDDKFVEYHSRPEYLNMLWARFGQGTVDHMVELTSKKLTRRIIEEEKEKKEGNTTQQTASE